MALRKQPRSIARELALLSISQIKKTQKGRLALEDIEGLILAAIRALTIEVQDNLEAASAELKRSEERILNSETRTNDLNSARVMVQEAISVSQAAVNRLGMAVEFPEFLQLTNKEQVRQYATEIITTVQEHSKEIETALANVLVAWQLGRLPKIDRDILRIAVAEIIYLEVPEKVAIDESVELAKRYSDEDGFRFINGVLRRLSDRLKQQNVAEITTPHPQTESTQTAPSQGDRVRKSVEPTEAETSKDSSPKVLPIVKQTSEE